ncbi:hypothetical protein A2U01_0075644, partial [Trifolium medium]|nr:hypothetical protein [Trifolium medium]
MFRGSLLYVVLEQRKFLAVVLEQRSPKLESLGKEVLNKVFGQGSHRLRSGQGSP